MAHRYSLWSDFCFFACSSFYSTFMWSSLASLILRYRVAVLIFLGLFTSFMGYHATNVKMTYKFVGLLPENDSVFIDYMDFIQDFSEDGNVLVIGVNDPTLYDLDNFQAWYRLGEELKTVSVPLDTIIDGQAQSLFELTVDSVFSVAYCYEMVKDTADKKFFFKKLLEGPPQDQAQVDSLRNRINDLPFYEGLLFKEGSDATLMMVSVNAEIFNSERRGNSMVDMLAMIQSFTEETGIQPHLSGLPIIRTEMTRKVKNELGFILGLAALVTALLLLVFFRNIRIVLVCMLVVGVGVIWSLGTVSLFEYRITMLMALIPPLMIVIGVPNCIYLVNKYHSEYKKHGNKMRSLTRVIEKMGNATFMTNMTTALGFGTFVFTHSSILREFGVIASINIIAVFIISILTIPSILSFLPAPKRKHVRHLDRKWLFVVVNFLVKMVQDRRKLVYTISVVILVTSLYGMTKIKTTGSIVGDLPSDDIIIQDLEWFEENFSGVMPFEIIIDAKRKGQILKSKNLKKINELQELLASYPEFSRSLSIVDASKFARQAFYNGNPARYDLIRSNEESRIAPYLKGNYETNGIESMFLDSSKMRTRVSAYMANVGTDQMDLLLQDLRPKIDSIFTPEKYNITITGHSVVFLEGTKYMVKNLLVSLALAVLVIAGIMSLLFKSMRMVLISLLPNMMPLIFTAGIMGYFGIALKPSTILVFSVAFGISVDDTIHFLAKYRQELKLLRWNIKQSVVLAVKETGTSMMYTSIVLFFGFSVFGASEFDGTKALGILVSVTLLMAMFTNLVLLPSLLLSLERSLTTKAFKEPFLEIIDEEEDIELKELEVQKGLFNREDDNN
ncbi:MAG: putative RND superfamily exporter protein [Flavobacteriales bacterium]|jgi:predicted RND superfamily exporter protein